MVPLGCHALPAGKLAMIVTYLQMRVPAPLRNVSCPDGTHFEPLGGGLETYRALIRRVGENWLWADRLRLSDEELLAVLNDPYVSTYTLLHDGTPSAILELDSRQNGACEITFFGVAPNLIGSGAGAYLMDRAIDLAFKQDITRLHLHTCTLDSPQALGFYVRSGFTPYKRAVEIVDDPRTTGLLPKSAAPHIPLL